MHSFTRDGSSFLTPSSLSSFIPLVDVRGIAPSEQASLESSLHWQIQQAIQSVLAQGDYILGRAVIEFELAFASACTSSYGVGVGSGLDAIALGLIACGIKPGDEVLLPANAPISTAMGVVAAGAIPVFVDVVLATGLLDLVAAEKAITPQTRALVPVHQFGQMVSPRQLLDLASTFDLLIFEDATQAHLAEREGYRAGAVGVAAAFCFLPWRNLGGMGDGGMVITADEGVAQGVRSLRDSGISRRHYHTRLGTCSRLDSIQAAVLSVKLPQLPAWNGDRQRLARHYDHALGHLNLPGISALCNETSRGHSYERYTIRISDQAIVNAFLLQAMLANQGIQTEMPWSKPCYRQPAFQPYQPSHCPNTDLLSQQSLSLPLYPSLSDEQQRRVIQALQSACQTSTRLYSPGHPCG